MSVPPEIGRMPGGEAIRFLLLSTMAGQDPRHLETLDAVAFRRIGMSLGNKLASGQDVVQAIIIGITTYNDATRGQLGYANAQLEAMVPRWIDAICLPQAPQIARIARHIWASRDQ